jgi:hypothetical protein
VERHSPYQGLAPFEEADAPYFFGRDRDIRLIVADLFASPLTLIYGASGVGKSSVLRAGVMPMLRQRESVLPLLFNTWNVNPLRDLCTAVMERVREAAYETESRIKEELTSDDLDAALDACRCATGRRLMIILDQFEEYFLYCPQFGEFDEAFAAAANAADTGLSFVISLREEALAGLDRFERRLPALFTSLRRVEHLSEPDARKAITEPLLKFTNERPEVRSPRDIDPALVDAVIEQIRSGQVSAGEATPMLTARAEGRIEPPYLQLVMSRLWEEAVHDGSPTLQLSALEALGGASKIIETHLDRTMERLPSDELHAAAEIFRFLVAPSGTKIAYSAPDLADYGATALPLVRSLLDKLAHGPDRILREVPAAPERPDERRFEIFHDRLAPVVLAWCRQFAHRQDLDAARRREMGLEQVTYGLVQRTLEGLGDRQQAAIGVLRSLVSEDGQRLAASVDELRANSGLERADVLKLLDCLSDTLVVQKIGSGGSEAEQAYTLAHDALVRPVNDWIVLMDRNAAKPNDHHRTPADLGIQTRTGRSSAMDQLPLVPTFLHR